MFRGRHDHRAHSKGRVALPAPWRAVLDSSGGPGEAAGPRQWHSGPQGLYAFLHPAGAVALVPESLKPALIAAVEGWVDRRSSELLLIVREEIIYGGGAVRPDPQGRVVIPKPLCHFAAVAEEPRDEMTWFGKGHYAELWSKQRHAERMRTGRYSPPQGCDWDQGEIRELAATFEETMGRIAGAIT